MRLAAKFTVALVGALALVLAVQGWVHYRDVAALHEEETRDDLTILSRAIGNATSALWASAGEHQARAYVREADARRTSTRITLVTGSDDDGESGPRRRDGQLVVVTPVVVDDEVVAHVELRRSLARAAEYRRDVIWSQVATTGLLALVAAVTSLVVGVVLIGRPVQRLIEHARRVARGELESSLVLEQRDELGNVARELNRMTEALAATRHQLREQRRASAALQEQLRHADRLSTVGRVASAIAHELGTPLNVVSGRAAMIATETEDPELVEHAMIIVEQSQRMTGIIRDLLDFSRRRGPQRADASIAEVMDQATTLLEPIAENRGVTIAVDDLGDMTARIDVNKTLQVLTNLMMNAVQAMPDGGTMRIGAETRHIDAPKNDHAEPGDFIALAIADEGVGMPAETLEQVFKPFFTTKKEGRGTGLGLYVCQGIVREQAGWIEAESEVGVGSTFTVYLPREDDAPNSDA